MTTSTRQILIGLALGVVAGLFLGERAAIFRDGVDGFVRLLQMTVLPYVTVSLIAGIGSLNAASAKRLFLRVGALTLVRKPRWSVLRNVVHWVERAETGDSS